jgi:hypothetical protein
MASNIITPKRASGIPAAVSPTKSALPRTPIHQRIAPRSEPPPPPKKHRPAALSVIPPPPQRPLFIALPVIPPPPQTETDTPVADPNAPKRQRKPADPNAPKRQRKPADPNAPKRQRKPADPNAPKRQRKPCAKTDAPPPPPPSPRNVGVICDTWIPPSRSDDVTFDEEDYLKTLYDLGPVEIGDLFNTGNLPSSYYEPSQVWGPV